MQKNLGKDFLLIFVLLLPFTFSACGSGSSGSQTVSGANIGISTVTNLPLPFDPVQSSSASSSNSALRSNSADTTTSGMLLNKFTENTYTSQSSLLSCQSTTQFLRALDAVNGTQVAYCALKYAGAEIEQSIPDLYSGNFTVFDLQFTQNGTPIPEAGARVKARVVRDSENNAITSFTVYVCGNTTNPPDGNFREFNYISLSIGVDGSFNMKLKGSDGAGPGTQPNGWHLGNISGKLQFTQSNSSDANSVTGTFTGSKTISVEQTKVDGDTFYSGNEFNQTLDTLTYQGYTYYQQGGTISKTQTHSLMDINNGNTDAIVYDIGKMLLSNGGGVMRAQSSTTGNSSLNYDSTFTEAWDGNTLLPDPGAENFSGETFLSLVSNYSVPDLPSTPLPDTLNSFTGDEADNCTTTAESVPSIKIEVGPYQDYCMNSLDWAPVEYYSCYNTIHAPN